MRKTSRVPAAAGGPTLSMMRQCRECHRVRSVQRGTPAELCETCDAAIAEEVHRRVRVIQEALRLIKQEETLSAKLKHCDRMLKEAEGAFRV